MGKLIIKIPENGHYPQDKDIQNLTAYIAGEGQNSKEQLIYVGAEGVGRDSQYAASQFIKVQRAFGKDNERRAYHMIVSFEETLDNPDIVIQASKAIGNRLSQKYQVFYGIHASTDNLHTHFAINAVSYADGNKWHMSSPELSALKGNILELVNCVMYKNNLPPLTI